MTCTCIYDTLPVKYIVHEQSNANVFFRNITYLTFESLVHKVTLLTHMWTIAMQPRWWDFSLFYVKVLKRYIFLFVIISGIRLRKKHECQGWTQIIGAANVEGWLFMNSYQSMCVKHINCFIKVKYHFKVFIIIMGQISKSKIWTTDRQPWQGLFHC